MNARSVLPFALVLLLANACGVPEREETRLELTILNLDPSATELQFRLSTTLDRWSDERRGLVAMDTRKIVFEHVVANSGLTIETKALRDGSVIQHGIVGGETTGAKTAAWTVTLAPITQNITVCDGLDNNANGQVDEASCSG